MEGLVEMESVGEERAIGKDGVLIQASNPAFPLHYEVKSPHNMYTSPWNDSESMHLQSNSIQSTLVHSTPI